MTQPKEATIEREKDKFWVSDAELIRLLGVPEKIMRATIKGLDENPRSGFPKKDKLFGGRRYMPAVKAWFDEYHQLSGVTIRDRRTA